MFSSSKIAAAVLLVSALASSVQAHGQMTKPSPFLVTDKYRADCYTGLKGAGEQELQYAPVENLLERKQDDKYAKTFDIMNGCRGMVAEADTPVTTLTAGTEFKVEYVIQAPHPGYLELAVVKPKTDADGKITYERVTVIKKVEDFAKTSDTTPIAATIPASVTGCNKAGDCALQFYWHSDLAKQTYPTCASIIVKGSSGGGASSGSATAPSTPASTPAATPAPVTPSSPAATTAPAPATPASTPAPTKKVCTPKRFRVRA